MGVWIETWWNPYGFRKSLVTPFVGVWIETQLLKRPRHCKKSHPSWVCGLKHTFIAFDFNTSAVTPFVGVWIETVSTMSCRKKSRVTPFVGVWIETLYLLQRYEFSLSHPSWVCGLKLPMSTPDNPREVSHPSWVCGLKLQSSSLTKCKNRSHPSWVCGLKLEQN